MRKEVENAECFETRFLMFSFGVLDGILLQDERDISTTLEGVAAGIRVDFKWWLVGIAGEDVLDRLGVLQ